MQPIEQLKTLRNDALTRLQSNTDYRLLTSLDRLIVDLESVNEGNARIGLSVVEPTALSSESVEEAFEKMTAELDSVEDENSSDERLSFNA